ncbi:MAG: EamA family transporter [Clostridiales bacterium]|nr:EamA family transporter [Clostridiales bacterium]
MIAYIWPLILVVFANTAYQICAKSVPQNMDPFASLTITYLVSALASLVLFFVMSKDTSLIAEYSKINWASIVFGIILVCLEVGFIFAYRAGWQVSVLSIVQSAFLAIALIVVGFLLYKEAITWNKVVGIVIVLVGLYFINKE